MRFSIVRASLSVLVSTAIAAAPLGQAYAQGNDAEGGQFETPDVVYAPSDEPPEGQPPLWQTRPSGQFVCDFAKDQAKAKILDELNEKVGRDRIKIGNDFVVGPLLAGLTAEGDEEAQVAAFITSLGEAGVELTLGGEVAAVLKGGQLLLNGTNYAIDSMVAGARDAQAAAILSDRDAGLGRIGNIGAYTPFIAFLQRQERYRYLTPDNLGELIQSEADLQQAWGQWIYDTRNIVDGGRDPATIEYGSDLAHLVDLVQPLLASAWRNQRIRFLIRVARDAVRRGVAAAQFEIGEAQTHCAAPNKTLASASQAERGLYSGAIDPPVTFEWDTKTRIHGIECFGGAQYAVYTDHYGFQGRYVGTDRREYDRVRAPLVASGAQFCGAWETRREETRK